MNIYIAKRHRLDITWKFLRTWGLPLAYDFLPKHCVEIGTQRYSVHTLYIFFIRVQLAIPENPQQ